MSLDSARLNVEIALNEIIADQTVFRLTLEMFLLRLLSARPDLAAEGLAEIKGQVLGAIERTLPNLENPQSGEKSKQMTLLRAMRMFQEMEEVVGVPPRPSPAQGAH